MAINKKYSYKDFMHQRFTDIDPAEFNDSEIVGSCFYQESPYDPDALSASPKNPRVNVFPASMTGVTFIRCNLDNCKIPGEPGKNTVGRRCSHRRIRVMNDLEDWELGVDKKPIEPLDKKEFVKQGWSTDPVDIPQTKVDNVRDRT